MEQEENKSGSLWFATDPLYRGAMDFVTKAFLGIIIFLANQMRTDMNTMMDSNADLLNRVIEMNVKMDNQNGRIDRNELDIKELIQKYYEDRGKK
jgi:hypothetical protein